MKNILLCCCAGMSTSLLVTKMQNYCKEKGINHNIWAVSSDKINPEIEKADIILLGPQIKFMKDEISELAKNKPVEVINMLDYGTMRGDNVVKFALKILGEEIK